MPEITVVDAISVHVATGETCSPREGGFSAIWAEIRTSDSTVRARLDRARTDSQMVTLRCAMVDVTGKVTRNELIGAECLFVVGVDDLIYRNPGNAAVST